MHWDDMLRLFLNEFASDPQLGLSLCFEMDGRITDVTSCGSHEFALALSGMTMSAVFTLLESRNRQEGARHDGTQYWVDRLKAQWGAFRAAYPPSDNEGSERSLDDDDIEEDDEDERAQAHMSYKASVRHDPPSY